MLLNYKTRKIPEYYPWMYLDGFEPWEIKYAQKKLFMKEFEEKRQREQQEKELEKKIEANLEETLNKALEELLKDFK